MLNPEESVVRLSLFSLLGNRAGEMGRAAAPRQPLYAVSGIAAEQWRGYRAFRPGTETLATTDCLTAAL